MTKYKIGRAPNNDIVIIDDSKTVSSEHAVIEMLKDKFYLTDNSVNGTYVNGKKIPNGMRFPVSEKDSILFANKYPFQWEMVKKVKTNRSTFKVNLNLTKPILITGSIVLFGYFIINPLSVHFLIGFDMGYETLNHFPMNSFMAIVASTTLAAGVMFELPVLIYFLSNQRNYSLP